LLVIFIYPIKVKGIPVDLSKFLLVSSWLFISYLAIKKIKIDNEIVFFILTFIAFSFFVFAMALFHNKFDLTIPRVILFYGLEYFVVATCLIVFFSRYLSFDDLLFAVWLAIFIQAIVMLLMLVIPPFKNIMLSILDTRNTDEIYKNREIGLTGFASYTIGIIQAFGFSLGMIVVSARKAQYRFFLLNAIVFITAILAARTSFLYLLPFILLLYLFGSKISKQFVKKQTVVLLVILSAFIVFLYYLSLVNEEVRALLNWVFEIFIKMYENGSLSTQSSDYIQSYYSWPNYETILYGDWVYSNVDGSFYKHVDAGYMRLMYYFGLPVSILFYFVFLCLAVYLSSRIKMLTGRSDIKVLFMFYLLMMFVLNYKGSAFIDASAVFKSLVFIYCAALLTLKNKQAVNSSLYGHKLYINEFHSKP